MDLLLDLRQDRGMTVIVATHDPVIASRCDRIVRLRDGWIVHDVTVAASGDVDAVLGRIGRLNPEA